MPLMPETGLLRASRGVPEGMVVSAVARVPFFTTVRGTRRGLA